MAASYPTTTKTFSTKEPGTKIKAEYVNDLQDEVVAVEGQLITSKLASLAAAPVGAQVLTSVDGAPTWAAKAPDADKLDGVDGASFGRPVFLSTPLSSTSWDGDLYSTTDVTLLDLSAVFEVPAGVKAVMLRITAKDSAAWGTTGLRFALGPSSTYYNNVTAYPAGGSVYSASTGIVICNADGDIYYKIEASGENTMSCYMQVWGYWL